MSTSFSFNNRNYDMVIKCIVSYDGTNYYGWQEQPGLNTVQKTIQDVLSKIHSGKDISISASGRTDAQVHALGQVLILKVN